MNPTHIAEIIWISHNNIAAACLVKILPNKPMINDGPALLQNATSLLAVR